MININFETGEILTLPLNGFVGASLKGLQLHRAIFDELNIGSADFSGSNLRSASFVNAFIDRAIFDRAALMNSNFMNSVMSNTSFAGAMAAFADFAGANLSCASFDGADIGGASFIRSNLCGADLCANRIEEAFFWALRIMTLLSGQVGFDQKVMVRLKCLNESRKGGALFMLELKSILNKSVPFFYRGCI